MNSSVTGAIAEPIMPAQVWKENTCVTRVGRNPLGQKRVIGRMIDRIGDTQQGEHRDEHPVGIDEPGGRHRARAQEQAADQIDARADAVDQEADRRLQHRRHDVEDDERKAELGIAHAIVGLDEHEQRRQQHHVIVAHEVCEAHAGHELVLARARRGQEFGRLRHYFLCCCEARGARDQEAAHGLAAPVVNTMRKFTSGDFEGSRIARIVPEGDQRAEREERQTGQPFTWPSRSGEGGDGPAVSTRYFAAASRMSSGVSCAY